MSSVMTVGSHVLNLVEYTTPARPLPPRLGGWEALCTVWYCINTNSTTLSSVS